MNENEIQFCSLPSNAEIALMEKEFDQEQKEFREFDQELG
jgi:hypothetical protein